jgi:prophage regulatory protein
MDHSVTSRRPAPGARIIRLDEVTRKVSYSGMHIWRLEQRNKFPRRVQIGPNSVGWIESEIDEWIASRIRAVGGQPWQLQRRWTREREEQSESEGTTSAIAPQGHGVTVAPSDPTPKKED